jgi:beta-glucosidase
MTFAPMLDVSRDPRWGRGIEGPGEDPWVGALLADAKVRGFQGASLSAADSLAAVAKHYCAYGPVTAGREYASVDVSERSLLEVHLPPFTAAVAAGVAAVMPAFTDLAGVPLTMHATLLRGWLRQRLGFDGVIVSDYNAIGELVRHGVAADLTEAAVHALKAGVDIDMMADAYRQGLPQALERGLVTMAEIDESVRRVLILKERLGLFADPFRVAAPETADVLAQRRALAREVGARAIVLLKNERRTLPLSGSVRRIAVIGPLADASAEMRGPWGAAGGSLEAVTVLAGLRTALPDAVFAHASGVALSAPGTSGIAGALEVCHDADVILLCVGEASDMSGEAASRVHLGLPGDQKSLAEAVLERARRLGKPVIVVLFSGRPLVLPWLIEKADAVLAAWFLGHQAGNAIADIVTGRVSPTGRTPMTWPRAVGQIPIFFAARPTGRPWEPNNHFTSRYIDESNEPLFPFGYGLTYGRFELSNPRVTPEVVSERDTIEARVDVANVGDRAAEETVFLFIRDRVASVTRPLLELKGFGKIALAPGERGSLTLSVPASELRFPGRDLTPVFEPGEIDVLLGPCADASKLLVRTVVLR